MPALTETQRQVFARIAEVIIPRTGTMPSAGDIDLAGSPIEAALAVRPDLVPLLAPLLDALAAEPARQAVTRLAATDPARFAVLMQAAAGAYYMQPEIWHRLGYPGQVALPPAVASAELTALTDRLARSPPRFRDVPEPANPFRANTGPPP